MKTTIEPGSPADRRPLATRSWPIFQKLAARLAASGVTPNSISVASMVFAALGALGFLITAWCTSSLAMRGGWLLAIVGIQLRLIANLLDGMVAVEGGRGSSTGPLYNEVPDRFSDIILLISPATPSQVGQKLAGQPRFLPCWSLTFARSQPVLVPVNCSWDQWPSRTAWLC